MNDALWKGLNGNDTADLLDRWVEDCGGRKYLNCPNCSYSPWSGSGCSGRCTRMNFYNVPEHHERCELPVEQREQWWNKIQENQLLLETRLKALRNREWWNMASTIALGSMLGLAIIPILSLIHNFLHHLKQK